MRTSNVNAEDRDGVTVSVTGLDGSHPTVEQVVTAMPLMQLTYHIVNEMIARTFAATTQINDDERLNGTVRVALATATSGQINNTRMMLWNAITDLPVGPGLSIGMSGKIAFASSLSNEYLSHRIAFFGESGSMPHSVHVVRLN